MEKPLPAKYENGKISCNTFSQGGFAWTRLTILEFLEDPETCEFAVLGGDVLALKDGIHSYTYDSWAAPERPRTEPFRLFCMRSKIAALEYIRNYPSDAGIVFTPVITSEVTAGWAEF